MTERERDVPIRAGRAGRARAEGPASSQPWLPPQAGQGWRRKAGYLRQAIEAINATR